MHKDQIPNVMHKYTYYESSNPINVDKTSRNVLTSILEDF